MMYLLSTSDEFASRVLCCFHPYHQAGVISPHPPPNTPLDNNFAFEVQGIDI